MNVLLCVGGGIGNVVMATPAAAALAELGHEVTLYLQPEATLAAELLCGWDALAQVVIGPPPAQERFDLAVHSVWSRRRGLHPREIVSDGADLRVMHEAEANMIPIRNLGFTGPSPQGHVELARGRASDIPFSQAEAPDTSRWAIAVGCKRDVFWERKRWGRCEELVARLDGPCVFLGEAYESRPWMSGPGRLDLCGKTTLSEAASWIAPARGFIGIDCGLAHVAGALGVPTVVLFGATSEVKNRPLGVRVRVLSRQLDCRPCQMTPRWDACTQWRCMDFDPDAVAAAAHECVERSASLACRSGG
ncbi:MAG: glycosyltransferase family 9 protein [Planctomycetota bacterium]